MPLESYDAFLHEELQDPELAAELLSTALEDGSIEEFLLALRQVAEARGGIGALATITDLNRQSMYKMLSGQGNPTLASLVSVLHALGLSIAIQPARRQAA